MTHDDDTEMLVSIRLFATLREHAGRNTVEVRLRRGASVAEAIDALSQIEPLAGLLARIPVRMAVNRDYATPDTELAPGDELALIPPVSGGAEVPMSERQSPPAGAEDERVHVDVNAEPLSLERLARTVSHPGAGAVVIFQGVTREVPLLEYEAYVEMASERIAQIADDCMAAHRLLRVAVEHRVGDVPLGEPSVIVAVSAAHRDEAFAGARATIDRVKEEAPIWKREP